MSHDLRSELSDKTLIALSVFDGDGRMHMSVVKNELLYLNPILFSNTIKQAFQVLIPGREKGRLIVLEP
jgi:hypothetical protein